jgi:hypothetical protein
MFSDSMFLEAEMNETRLKIVNKLIAMHKRIRDLQALKLSKKVAVTLWPDNYNETGVGAVIKCEEFVSQSKLKSFIAKAIKKEQIKARAILKEVPKKDRAIVNTKTYEIAMKEKF